MRNEDYEEVELTKNYSPSRLERETIIILNDEEDYAEVFTMNQSMIRKLDKLCETNDDITCDKAWKVAAVTVKEYTVPKKWIKVAPPRKVNLSEERKMELAERLKKIRWDKNAQNQKIE